MDISREFYSLVLKAARRNDSWYRPMIKTITHAKIPVIQYRCEYREYEFGLSSQDWTTQCLLFGGNSLFAN